MNNFFGLLVLAFTLFGLFLFVGSNSMAQKNGFRHGGDLMDKKPEGYPTAVFGGGCFWCTESEYRALDGVLFTRTG